MIDANRVKQQVHAVLDILPESKLMTLLDSARYLAERGAESELLLAQLRSAAYRDWLGADNDVYDGVFAHEPATR